MRMIGKNSDDVIERLCKMPLAMLSHNSIKSVLIGDSEEEPED